MDGATPHLPICLYGVHRHKFNFQLFIVYLFMLSVSENVASNGKIMGSALGKIERKCSWCNSRELYRHLPCGTEERQ
jgi:hypothetical protein